MANTARNLAHFIGMRSRHGAMSLRDMYRAHEGKVSDKWELYLSEYDRLFSGYRNLPLCLLEIGVQNGGSLEIWSKYFDRAEKLVGCDINPDCRKLAFDDERISVIVADANTDVAETQIRRHSPVFDLVIDDGSDKSGDIVKSFLRYFPLVKDGGLYVVEDLCCSYWQECDGGLYAPHSSSAFFRTLVDVASHEHWGLKRAPETPLEGFSSHYGISFDMNVLTHIHSIEFINALCVIRKAPPAQNSIGRRVAVGTEEIVVPLRAFSDGVALNPPDQMLNPWSIPPKNER